MADNLKDLIESLRRFAAERDWEKFHTPKNLGLAMASEIGELLAELRWKTDEQIAQDLHQPELFQSMEEEVADVLIFLVRFADVCGIDVISAAHNKVERNERRYPVTLSYGSSAKYTEYEGRDAPTGDSQ